MIGPERGPNDSHAFSIFRARSCAALGTSGVKYTLGQNVIRKFMGCLILLVGTFLVWILWVSIGWSETETWTEKTAKYVAIIILIPVILSLGFGLLRNKPSEMQSLNLDSEVSDRTIDK